MKLIDADALKIDMEETVFDGDGTYKVYGYSSYQIKRAPTITPPPNDPLTLDELRAIHWEPIWVQRSNGVERYYIAVNIGTGLDLYCGGCGYETFADYGKTWLAYRRKPEES